MSKVVDITTKFSRQNCKTELKRIGFDHQDKCELCQKRMEVAWLVALYIKQSMNKFFPKDYEPTGGDIHDILLTALYNLGLDPTDFSSTIKE